MIYFSQLIYILDGQQQSLLFFEKIAIPLSAKYYGKLLLRYRPTPENLIGQNMETPYEIH